LAGKAFLIVRVVDGPLDEERLYEY